ncbi:protein disabled isoform X4 [Eurosta solidaginis]|uniref:protein disabled isoform X4 n=1 Tax=Eurosta solidaginis TaxID=178769 RepID=UPI00353089E3
MVKSLVSKLSAASSNLSLASTLSSVGVGSGGGGGSSSIQETNYAKHRNDPGRFFGDGVQFKAKLIGILEVGEARGDRMCQEALQDLKMAIRAAGEHKQRITIHVTIDGLRLRDEKTGDSLYHHPVHKISFIAQDMTDSRAFGYIFGSPDSGHRFFGIKTDKAASQVVLAMRDLFQVVFELKKKEIELARQQIQSKSIHEHQLSSLSSLKSAAGGGIGVTALSAQNDLSNSLGGVGSGSTLSMLSGMAAQNRATASNRLGVNMDSKGAAKEMSPESVADLVDLEQELSSIQRGITQMERITPNEPSQPIMGGSSASKAANDDDPFGDSFTNFPSYNLLPPPESGRSRHKSTTKPTDTAINKTSTSVKTTSTNIAPQQNNTLSSLLATAPASLSTSPGHLQQQDDDDSWLHKLDTQNDVFDTSKAGTLRAMGVVGGLPMAPLAPSETISTPTQQLSENSTLVDVEAAAANTSTQNASSGGVSTATAGTASSSPITILGDAQSQAAVKSDSTTGVTTKNAPASTAATADGASDVVMMPRDTDPFSPTRKKSDPFQEGSDVFSKLDPFEFEFNSASAESANQQRSSPTTSTEARRSADVFSGPLQVNLPPESSLSPIPAKPLNTAAQWRADVARLERQMGEPISMMGNGSAITVGSGSSTVRSRPTQSGQLSAMAQPSSAFKQQTVDVISSISNKKMPHLFGQARFSKRDSNSINMCRLQESDSLSENEAAPEPPPRPDSALHAEPPPLPPKKQFNDIIIRPRVTSGNAVPPSASSSAATANSRYEFVGIATHKALRDPNTGASDVPPIPLPSRRISRSDGIFPGPGRPRKPGHTEDDYLAPISGGMVGAGGPVTGDVPPLLPPPTQTSTRTRAQRQQSFSKAHDIYENKMEILQQQQQKQQQALAADGGANTPPPAIIPDITLSQLMTLSLDDLAAKLSVPVSKLSTMTLVELTSYLSEFIEKSKPQRAAVDVISSEEALLSSHISPLTARRREAALTKTEQVQQAPIFKVNFDQQATFVAKFDDTFGEDLPTREALSKDQDTFANFEQFIEPPIGPPPILGDAGLNAPTVPPADRYAVFREIIDKELQEQQENSDLIGEEITEQEGDNSGNAPIEDAQGMAAMPDDIGAHFEANFDNDDFLTGTATDVVGGTKAQPAKIDTKITEVVAQAKDRYAALRDIILVENLFDNKPPPTAIAHLQASQEFPEFSDEFNEDQDQDLKHIMDGRTSSRGPDRLGLVDSRGLPAEPSSSALTIEDEDDEGGGESSLDSNEKDGEGTRVGQDKYQKLSTSTQQLDSGDKSDKLDMNGGSLPERSASQPSPNLLQAQQDSKFLTVASSIGCLSSSKDDLEIDELMQRAISNLSLDSRERISPANSTTNMPTVIVTAGSLTALPHPNATLSTQTQFNDVSTSPIPLQKSPTLGAAQQRQQQRSPLSKSLQPSPILTQLSAVSSLIDTATKQIHSCVEPEVKHSKEFWATFDSPKPSIEKLDKRARTSAKPAMKTATLHLPPPPPSNTSQNDTAESPCSSDPRDEGWSKSGGAGRRWPKKERHQTSSSSRDLSPWDDDLSDFQKQKRIPGVVGSAKPPPGITHVADRHGYHMRHTRRLNSCDEDYDYEDEFSARRDHRKLKPGLSRSRDNFDLEAPNWYHHAPHHTWSPQEMEQAANLRARAAFERSAYERTTYGPPVYEKRGVALPPNASSSYDRRIAYDKRGSKYYRDYARSNYDFDDYGDVLHDRYRDAASYDKPSKSSRRADYENIYDDGRTPMAAMTSGSGGVGYKSRTSEYLYERERKSFDRESIESFESATRRRRSFGSGDVYGSMESHEDFRERFGPDKTRSLRKSMKLRATGDIEYEQDSENDFHQRARMSGGANVGGMAETRSMQRPNQLSSVGGGGTGMVVSGGQTRARKSSGSSPWDGEEPPLPGQKSWKRPSSAAESERRHAEGRRAVAHGQTPSGSDGEKDRRFRKKQRSRGKEIPYSNATGALPSTGSRYSSTVSAVPHLRDNYDYITYDDDVDDEEDYVDEDYDEPPTDEDKFERLNRRRHEMHQRMLESERKQHSMGKVPISALKCSAPINAAKKYPIRGGGEYDFDDYEQTPTPRSNASASLASAGSSYLAATTGGSGGGGGLGGSGSIGGGSGGGSVTKFSFDGGFESDFNQSSPPPAPAGTASSCNSTPAATTASASATPATKSSFRFSNDFSEREKMHTFAQNSTSVSSSQQFDMDGTPSPALPTTHTLPAIITQKLRFDDNVKVSQFDDAAFEDDFSNAQFDFEKEDQWHADSLQNTGPSITGLLPSATAKKHNLRNSKLQQRQELIKKSESINIFAKKSEDPFEDDEFFKAPNEAKLANNNNNNNGKQSGTGNGDSGSGTGGGFQCDDDFNFAKFDENM